MMSLPRDGGGEYMDVDKLGAEVATWRVVSDNPADVRLDMHIHSPCLGMRRGGDLVRGCSQAGWVQLMGEPGFIVILSQRTGKPTLELVEEARSLHVHEPG